MLILNWTLTKKTTMNISSKHKHFRSRKHNWERCLQSISHLVKALQWRHNERDGVSNHRLIHCLLSRLFKHRSKKISKLRVTSLCEGNSPMTGEFLAQRASSAENATIWWRHHETVCRRHCGCKGWVDWGSKYFIPKNTLNFEIMIYWFAIASSGALSPPHYLIYSVKLWLHYRCRVPSRYQIMYIAILTSTTSTANTCAYFDDMSYNNRFYGKNICYNYDMKSRYVPYTFC